MLNQKKIVDYITDKEYMDELIKSSERDLNKYIQQEIHVITIPDESYPRLLLEIDDPPTILYCRGNIEALFIEKKIAIIGTRNATAKGLNAAGKVASTFARMNYAIVSGLATGIDTAGHIGALEANGVTIAVLPGGVDDVSIYPAKNKKLARDIIDNKGLLLSEYPPGQKPVKASFVQRDRLQSGLSLGVCPVQTDITGGTQHTIKFAETQGRLLFFPIPSEEGDIPAYRGIYKLNDEGKAHVLKNKESYFELDKLMGKLIINQTTKLKKRTEIENREEITLFNFNNEHNQRQEIDDFHSLVDELCRFANDLRISQEEVIKMLQDQWKTWR